MRLPDVGRRCVAPRRAFAGFVCAGFILLGLASCGGLTVRTTVNVDGATAALQGEWQGTWKSSGSAGSGALTLRIQQFDNQPLAAVSINNAYLPTSDYELVINGDSVTLQVHGVPIFNLVSLTTTFVEGSYASDQDAGTWAAIRLQDLPPPLDLGGTWLGNVSEPGQFDLPLMLQLHQFVDHGTLVVEGEAQMPRLLTAAVPVIGYVHFREHDFELVLQTVDGTEPDFVLSGIGTREPLQVGFGMMQVVSGSGLPFTVAGFQIAHQTP